MGGVSTYDYYLRKVVLVRGDEENDSRVTLTKEELFVAASRFDGFDWVITF